MTKFRSILLASAIGLVTTTAASAAFVTPQIPNPANPHPAFPIATDGSPLPPMGWAQGMWAEPIAPYPADGDF